MFTDNSELFFCHKSCMCFTLPHIYRKDTFMNSFFMLSKMSLWSRPAFTLFSRILSFRHFIVIIACMCHNEVFLHFISCLLITLPPCVIRRCLFNLKVRKFLIITKTTSNRIRFYSYVLPFLCFFTSSYVLNISQKKKKKIKPEKQTSFFYTDLVSFRQETSWNPRESENLIIAPTLILFARRLPGTIGNLRTDFLLLYWSCEQGDSLVSLSSGKTFICLSSLCANLT